MGRVPSKCSFGLWGIARQFETKKEIEVLTFEKKTSRETAISPSHIVFRQRLVAFLKKKKMYFGIAQMKILYLESDHWEKCLVLRLKKKNKKEKGYTD